MAEPVIVPVKLEVTDIDMSNFNPKDVQKAISSAMSGVKKSIQDVFSGIDASAINKPIEKSMSAIESGLHSAEKAHLKYNEAILKAAKSVPEYGEALKEIDSEIAQIEKSMAQWADKSGTIPKQIADAYAPALEQLKKRRADLNPLDYIDKAAPIELEKVALAYKEWLSSIGKLNQKTKEHNEIVKDNRASDEYQELVKQAEVYKKKLADLNEKSKEMKFKGATDTQWENLRKEVEWTELKMNDVLKLMDKAIKSGKAFRFGEGPKGEFRNQYNSFAMSAKSNAKYATERAKENQSPYTADYQKALDDLDKLEKKVAAIKEKSAKMIALGASNNSLEALAYDAEQLSTKVDEAKNRLTELVKTGNAFKFGNGDASAEMSKITATSDSLKSSLSDVSNDAAKAQGGLAKLAATNPKLAAVLGTVLKIGKGFATAAKGVAKVVSAIGKAAQSVASFAEGIISGIKNLNLFGKSGRTTSTDLNKRFKRLGKTILMYGFGFRTMYYAIKKLRTIFIDGFKTMGDQFEEFGQPMTRFIESLNRLKGSLATAFQPLVSVVMPLLTKAMDYLSGILEAIGKFNAALTGQGYIYKAVANDIDSVSDSAKEANKQLGSYDKLEVIDKNDAGYSYEKQTIGETQDAASNFANMVKAAWEKADFTSVGEYVTERLLEVLDKIHRTIIPKAVGFVNKLTKSINTFLEAFDSNVIGSKVGSIVNTIVANLNFNELGKVFANMYNTVWGFFDGLVNKIDWKVVGYKLSGGLSTVVSSLNFDSLAGMIKGLTMGIVDVISQIKWGEIANKLLAGLQTILQTVGTAMSDSNNPLVSAFGDVILTINETITALKPAVESIIQAVGPIIQSILPVINRLLPPIASVVSMVVSVLLPPLVRLVQTVIPLLTSLVELIMPGLELTFTRAAEGIAIVIDAISSVAGALDVVISTVNVFSKAFRGIISVKDIFKELLNAWKTPMNNILAAFEGFLNGLIKPVNSIIDKINGMGSAIGIKKGLPTIPTVKIPRLAQGAVIPPNKEFLAVLGDQRNGTNIEAPLDTIKQALAEVLAEIGGGNREPIVLQVSGRTLAKVVWDEQEKRYKQTGKA